MNPHRGEVALVNGATTYTLRFSVNAIIEMEDELGEGVNAIAEQISDAKRVRMKTIRALLWAGLRDHHPEVTQAQAGEILSDIGMAEAMEPIGRAFALAFPDQQEDGPARANGARPRKAGVGSTSSPATPKQG